MRLIIDIDAGMAEPEETHPTDDVYVTLPCSRDEADEGAEYGDIGRRYWRRVLVQPDGGVLAWDRVASHYTRCHSLTEAQMAEARRMAGRD